jgi:hypothetical protein
MSHSCAQWRGEIGAYLAGALDSGARDRVARHLAACADCRADYDELVPVRDWLGLLAFSAGGLEPGPANSRERHTCRVSGTQRLAHPTGGLRVIRPRTRRWLLTAGPVLAAAAAAVAVLVSSAASDRTFRAVDNATGVSAHARLHGTPAGTQIDLTASGLPGDERCILVAVTSGGSDIAGSWDATYDGRAQIAGTTAFPASQLTTLRIESDTGILLLSIRV